MRLVLRKVATTPHERKPALAMAVDVGGFKQDLAMKVAD